MKKTYLIDKKPFEIDVAGDLPPTPGDEIVLAKIFNDPIFDQSWYEQGYKVITLFDPSEFSAIKQGLLDLIQNKLDGYGIDTKGFELEKYHHYVDDETHYKIVEMTRELYPDDFGFSTDKVRDRLSNILKKSLSYTNPLTKKEHWLIVRINRPGSTDFNPVHKDIYENYDKYNKIPPMINFWIPICGTGGDTGLPVAPGSHLLSEREIIRYPAGCIVNGKRYHVNNIMQWSDSSELKTIVPEPGSLLMFSSHLIHGLGRNLNPDTTRISFEFRLYADKP